MNTTRIGASLIAAFCITTGGSAVAAQCQAVLGTFKLTADPSCGVIGAYAQVPPRDNPPPQPLFMGQPGTCFKVEVNGSLKGSGFAGLTAELFVGANGVPASAPALAFETGLPADGTLPQPVPGHAATRQFFTARSVLTLKGGKIYTADAGVGSHMGAAEQIRIVAGEGSVFEKASGTIYLVGNSMSGAATPYAGNICFD